MVKQREQILEDIKSLADDKYKEFHSGLCPDTNNILGVRVPVTITLVINFMKK